MKSLLLLATGLGFLSQLGCATHGTVVVRSEPIDATVFLMDTKSGQSSVLGKTPLTFSKKLMANSDSDVFQLRLDKEGFNSKYTAVAALGHSTTYLDVKLTTALAVNQDVRKAFELNRELLAEANRLASAKRFAEALARVEKILESDPKNDEAYAAKGSLLFLMKDFDGAQTWWKKALELNPSNDLVRASLVDLNLGIKSNRAPASSGR